jgi:hypothetical protein
MEDILMRNYLVEKTLLYGFDMCSYNLANTYLGLSCVF